MTVTFPLAFLNPNDVESVELTMRSITAMSISPYTGIQQVQRHPGQYWLGRVQLVPLRRTTSEDWAGWLASLYGPYGTFLMGDPLGGVPRGSAQNSAGAPKLSTANHSGDTLPIYGAPASVSNWLLRGDYCQVGSGTLTRLYKVVQNVSTTSGGVATVQIWPMLRDSPSSGQGVVVTSCQGIWRLDNINVDIARRRFLETLSFTIIEAL